MLSLKTNKDLKVVIRASIFEGQILIIRENEAMESGTSAASVWK